MISPKLHEKGLDAAKSMGLKYLAGRRKDSVGKYVYNGNLSPEKAPINLMGSLLESRGGSLGDRWQGRKD
jgi:hypothetical protein